MNDTDPLDELRIESIQLYDWNLPASYAQFFTASACALCNLLVVLNCFASRSLRRRSYYVVMANLAVADAWIGGAYMYVSARRLYDHYMGVGNLRTEQQCLTDVLPMTFGLVASTVFTLMLCCDRCAALIWPQRYVGHSVRLTSAAILTGWLYTAADAVSLALSIDYPDDMTPMCTNSGVYGNSYNLWLLASTIVYSCLALIFSLICLYRVVHLLKLNVQAGTGSRELHESAITIAIIAGLLVLTQVASRIGYLYLAELPKDVRSRYGNFMRLPQMFNSMINLFVYLTRSSLFRREFRALLRLNRRAHLSTGDTGGVAIAVVGGQQVAPTSTRKT